MTEMNKMRKQYQDLNNHLDQMKNMVEDKQVSDTRPLTLSARRPTLDVQSRSPHWKSKFFIIAVDP